MKRRENSSHLPMYLFEDESPQGTAQCTLQGSHFYPDFVLFTINDESVYLSEAQARDLLFLLQAFVDTGNLP